MKIVTLAIYARLLLCLGYAIGDDATSAVALHLRIQSGQKNGFICEATNRTQQIYRFWRADTPFMNGNTFVCYALDSTDRYVSRMGGLEDFIEEPPTLDISALAVYRLEVRGDDFWAWLPYLQGHFISVSWVLNTLRSPMVYVAVPDTDGNIISPRVDPKETSVRPLLAFVFRKINPHDFAFLLLNGTNSDVSLPPPLVNESRLVVTAPSIGYSNEVYSVETAPELVQIEPGKHYEWRIPWTAVFGSLPEADRLQLQTAKDIDLVWKAGNHVSSPLPLTLPDPE